MAIYDEDIFYKHLNYNMGSQLAASQQDIYRNLASACMCSSLNTPYVEPCYFIGEKRYNTKSEIPRISVVEWARKQGLKISNDGKTLTCYKVALKTGTKRYLSMYDHGFAYTVGDYAEADIFDSDQFTECSYGLHGCNVQTADAFASRSYNEENKAFLEVDISDPDNFVIPYHQCTTLANTQILLKESDKIRFKKCYVNRVMNLSLIKQYFDEETGESFYF